MPNPRDYLECPERAHRDRLQLVCRSDHPYAERLRRPGRHVRPGRHRHRADRTGGRTYGAGPDRPRTAGLPMVYLKMQHSPDLGDTGGPGSPHSIKHARLGVGKEVPASDGRASRVLVENTWDTDILPRLAPQMRDVIVAKHRYSGFISLSPAARRACAWNRPPEARCSATTTASCSPTARQSRSPTASPGPTTRLRC
jgi:hypothetical protein